MKKSTVAPLLACLLLSPLAFTSCTDDHYDLNEVDSTIGVGSDGLRLPTSSTDEIQLSDVLELNESDVVKIQENGDYMFEQDGGDVTPARPMIDIIQISKQSTPTSEALVIPKNLITGINAMGKKTGVRKADNIGKEAPVNKFDFSGNKPAEVLSLKTVSVDANIKLAVSFSSALKSCVTKIAKLSLNMPSYMSFTASTTSGDLSVNGNKITLANISTANEITLNIDINALDFKSGNNGTLAIDEDGKIKMDGTVVMGVEISPSDINLSGLTSGDLSITSQIQFPDFKVTGAQGRFSPTIDLGNLGEATINNVPDFLKDGNVVVDLANPQIWLTTNSDLTLDGYVDGVIKAYKKGQVIASVNVDNIKIKANETSKICICRNAASLEDRSMFTDVIEVPTLSTLIRTIPDKLVFEANARADSQNEYAITFGRQYNISPSYTIKAPIAFAKDARIVYNDSIEDMNKDLKDLDFAEGTYINVDANVENKVPAHLTVSAYAVDVNGKRMSDDLISIVVSNVVAGSPDGTTPVVTPLNVKVQQKKAGVLKNVDKLMFTIEGSAKENGNIIEGVTLNAYKHTLVARDIVVKVVGKMIIE